MISVFFFWFLISVFFFWFLISVFWFQELPLKKICSALVPLPHLAAAALNETESTQTKTFLKRVETTKKSGYKLLCSAQLLDSIAATRNNSHKETIMIWRSIPTSPVVPLLDSNGSGWTMIVCTDRCNMVRPGRELQATTAALSSSQIFPEPNFTNNHQ